MSPKALSKTVSPVAISTDHLPHLIRRMGKDMGFEGIGFAQADLTKASAGLKAWLTAGFHGEMNYMEKRASLRENVNALLPGTISIITARMNYLADYPPLPRFHHKYAQDQRVEENNMDKFNTHSDSITKTSSGQSNHSRHLTTTVSPQDTLTQEPLHPVITAFNISPQSPTAPHLSLAIDEEHPLHARVSRYAWGPDYHQVMRQQLRRLAVAIAHKIGPFGYRAFTDSAPVFEAELAVQSGLGWRGKHTLIIDRQVGSFFFLGEIYTTLNIPSDKPVSAHCGSCFACAAACPTGAIVAPYQVDARRCISYLTIELRGSIPIPLRPAIGNRIYGCDDCQTHCPWNRFAKLGQDPHWQNIRNGLNQARLLELFAWEAEEFQQRMDGSAILRIGHAQWLRNIAVALGNALRSIRHTNTTLAKDILGALQNRKEHPSEIVREHVTWAINQGI